MTPELLADVRALSPEIWLTVTIVVTLLADLIVGQRGRHVVGLLALVGVGGALWALGLPSADATAPSRAFGLLSMDGFADFFRTLIISGTAIVVLHAIVFREIEDETRNEFLPMLVTVALGGCLLVSTDHLLMLLLSMELLSLPSYLLAGWQRRERRSAEAALKYLVFGALASSLMLFGFSLLYGISGSLWMPDIGRAVAEQWSAGGAGQGLVAGATVLVFAGFGFKIAVFPFHFWAPDVYEGSPTPVTTLLAVVSKAAGVGLVVRFVDAVFLGEGASADWVSRFGWIMAVLAAVTMTYGNITAVLQHNVKRLLAYSSIAHAGFLLMGVAVMTTDSTGAASATGVHAIGFYLVTYYLATLGAFACVMSLSNRFGVEDLDDYQGLGWSSPVISGLLVVFLVSLTGLPPTAGFIGKYKIFLATFDTGLFWLAVVGALNAVVALFYYFKLARALFLRGDWDRVEGRVARGVFPALAQASIGVLAAAVVYYGLAFDGLAAWVDTAFFS